MRLLKTVLILLGLLSPVFSSFAADTEAEQILERLRSARPDLQYEGITASPLPGFYSVQISNGPMIYVTADGQHFIAGDLFAISEGGFVNLAELGRQKARREMLASLDESEMIIFAPKQVKATVTVFTDIDCGYCQKLHLEVPELNKLGVAIRYLAYPRAGVGSTAFRKAATAWCAENPQDAITRLKNREVLDENVCKDNPVARQFSLGGQLGVTGTPALILEDGTLVPGYMPAETLAKRVGAIL